MAPASALLGSGRGICARGNDEVGGLADFADFWISDAHARHPPLCGNVWRGRGVVSKRGGIMVGSKTFIVWCLGLRGVPSAARVRGG
jgi:hypothetical protein